MSNFLYLLTALALPPTCMHLSWNHDQLKSSSVDLDLHETNSRTFDGLTWSKCITGLEKKSTPHSNIAFRDMNKCYLFQWDGYHPTFLCVNTLSTECLDYKCALWILYTPTHLIKDRWTPRDLCVPEQSIHRNTPYVMLAQLGFLTEQSKQI